MVGHDVGALVAATAPGATRPEVVVEEARVVRTRQRSGTGSHPSPSSVGDDGSVCRGACARARWSWSADSPRNAVSSAEPGSFSSPATAPAEPVPKRASANAGHADSTAGERATSATDAVRDQWTGRVGWGRCSLGRRFSMPRDGIEMRCHRRNWLDDLIEFAPIYDDQMTQTTSDRHISRDVAARRFRSRSPPAARRSCSATESPAAAAGRPPTPTRPRRGGPRNAGGDSSHCPSIPWCRARHQRRTIEPTSSPASNSSMW